MATTTPLGTGSAPPFNTGAAAGTQLIAAGSYVHLAAAGNQVVPIAGMLATDIVMLTVIQNDATLYVLQGVAAAGQFTAFAQTAPAANCKVGYAVFR